MVAPLSLFCLFFYLGCISFGGPTAHIALFQQELIEKRKWMSNTQYAQLVAICQFLPGPSSSQVGMALGFKQAGYWGAFIAWLGFTLPSATILCAFAIGMMSADLLTFTHILQGLKIAACTIVAYAVVTMIKAICTQTLSYLLLLIIALACWYFGQSVGQWVWILCGATFGVLCLKNKSQGIDALDLKISHSVAYSCLGLLIAFWCFIYFYGTQNFYADIGHIFYRSGAMVFGGGHVVLPLLQQDIVATGLLDESLFTAGYGVVQAMPGPLFNFASYLGGVLIPNQPLLGAILATVMIFLPAALILFGCLPFIQKVLHLQWLHGAMVGINVSVIGILIATLFDPMLIKSISGIFDIFIFMTLFIILYFKRLPVWAIVILSTFIYRIF